MDTRELKALEIAARCKLTFDGSAWQVPSQSSPSTKYRVTINPPSCTCEDFQLRQQPCKHVIAARLVAERDGGAKAPALDTEVVPVKLSYKQSWPAYNLAQSQERHRFQVLLHDLCRNLPDPPTKGGSKGGRRPHRVSDAVFAMAYKVYGTFSSRRSSCDLKDAHERGYLSRPISGMKVCAFFENAAFTPILKELIERSSLPLRSVETVFAPDSTGFSTSRFVRWFDEKYGAERSGHAWVKAHAICGVKTNIVTAVEILDMDAADCPQFKPLVEATAKSFTVKEVTADKAYLSHENLALVAGLGGTPYIPFKSHCVPGEAGSLWERLFFFYGLHREEFLDHYHQRSNAESTFNMVKAKFRDHVRRKTEVAQKNEVLCKFLCHNICCVIQSQCELGIDAAFWPAEEAAGKRDVLPLVRPG